MIGLAASLAACRMFASAQAIGEMTPVSRTAEPDSQGGSSEVGIGDKRVYIEIFIKGERRDEKVAGSLVSHDETSVTILTTTGTRRVILFSTATPASSYTFKMRFIDRTKASDWLKLGRWAWGLGYERQARQALMQARQLDAGLIAQVDEILKSPLPSAVKPVSPPTSAPSRDAEPDSELMGDENDDPAAPKQREAKDRTVTGDGLVQQPTDAPTVVVQFQPATPEQHARAIARSKRRAGEVEKLLRIELETVETNHFLIFTDWDVREHQFLSNNCEQAYQLVAKNFNLNPKENIFIGKLPVFMFKNQADFQKFSEDFDEFRAPRTVLGYFVGRGNGFGHMAMWKPRVGAGVNAATDTPDAERRWARTLLHEFVHAFVSRYRTNRPIPRWLNEGVAEYISEQQFPSQNYYGWARQMAIQQVDINPLFDDAVMPPGEFYPVMMTLVEVLAKENPKAFISFFAAIKDGMEPEEALQKHFNVGYDGLQLAWSKYAKRLR